MRRETRTCAAGRSRTAWAVSMLALGLLSSASAARAVTAPPAVRALPVQQQPDIDDEDRERMLEKFKGLGYVTWDFRADPNLNGVTVHDAARTAPGYNLFTDNGKKIFLMDADGKNVRTWEIENEGKTYTYAEILPDGRLALLFHEHGLATFDWNGKRLWKIDMPAHHDYYYDPSGTILALIHEKIRYKDRTVLFDSIVALSPKGETLWKWSTFEYLEEIRKHHPASRLDTAPGPGPTPDIGVSDYYHMNSLERLPATSLGARDKRFREGNLLVSFRNVSLIAVLDKDDRSIQWSWGPGTLEYQHMPTMLTNGHILLFDNGPFRGYSRVLEIEPPSGKIVWSYESSPREKFLSKEGGGSERLSNGNTLICETDRGHAFEVTPSGEIVWEFWNPDLVRGRRNRFYRFTRVPPALVDPLLRAEKK